MSLRRLLKWHRFTVQTNVGAGQSDTGAIERVTSWVDLNNYVNLFGHLQTITAGSGKGRDDRIYDFGKAELETYWVIFHNHRFLTSLDTRNRILVNLNPKLPIPVLHTERKAIANEIRIYKIISVREPVSKRNKDLFELYLQLDTRGTL